MDAFGRNQWPISPEYAGNIAILGAGAIGSGFAFNLWLSDYATKITMIDRDRYEEPNLETTLLIPRESVIKMHPKAFALAEALNRNPRVKCSPIVADIAKGSSEIRQNWDAFVCAVDNLETRRALDEVKSRVLLNGAVGGTRLDSGHILWSRHGQEDPPLSNLYTGAPDIENISEPPPEASDTCSRIAYLGVTMAAPFVGLACGALLAASCVRQSLGMRPDVNYFKFDILGHQARYRRELKLYSAPSLKGSQ